MDNGVIPLLPLSIVVFPGDLFPLHLYDEKFKQLIKDTLNESSPRPFGITALFENMLAQVGCCCVIDKIVQEFPDGRLDVLVRGNLRFRIIEEKVGTLYSSVYAEFFDDDDKRTIDENLKARVITLFTKYTELKTGKPMMRDFDPTITLSYTLASLARLTNPQRQMLLEITSEQERLEALDAIFTEVVTNISEQVFIEEKVRSNGHLKH